MALSPESNEAFFREVDEEMRRDQLAGFGRRYGIWIGVAILVVIAAVGGWLFWHHSQQSRAGEVGVTYNAALNDLGNEKIDDAAKKLAGIDQTDIEGYRAMSRFLEADIALQKDDLKAAAAKFAAVADDEELAKPYRDLAVIRRTLAEYDSLKPEEIIQRLRPLAMKDSPWFGTAGEMVAIAYLRAGKTDLAVKMFDDLAASQDIPDSVRQRAVQIAGALDTANVKGAADDKKTEDKKAG